MSYFFATAENALMFCSVISMLVRGGPMLFELVQGLFPLAEGALGGLF